MGLETADRHSHTVQTTLYKFPKFGVNGPNSSQDTAILKCQNLQRNWPSGPCVWMTKHFFIQILTLVA